MKWSTAIVAMLALSLFSWGGTTPPPAPSAGTDFKTSGDQYFKKGIYESAVAAYQEFINQNPSDSAVDRVAKRVGDYYYTQKQYAEAAQYLSMVKGKSAIDVPFRLKLGRSLQLSGKNAEAIAILQPLAILTTLKIDVRQSILKTLGDACLAAGNNEKALSWYTRYLKITKVAGPDISYSIAVLQEQDNPAQARLMYQNNIKKFPTDQRNYLRLGILLSKSKATYTSAAALLKKAIDLSDTVPSAWLELARLYGRMKKPNDEISAYENYLRFDAANLEAKSRIGIINLGKGNTDEAMRMLQDVYKQAPDSSTAAAALADGYLRTGKTTEAIDLLVKVKAAKPKDTLVRRLLFQAYRMTKQDQPALDELKALLELRRDNDLLLAYGKMLLKMGKLDEAANAIEDIRATDPENLDALMALGSILRAQKKFEESIEIYKEAAAIDMKYAPATFERAEVYLEQGKVKWAEQFYKRAFEQDPNMALAQLGLAKVALACNNRNDYLAYLDKAESMDPDNPVIKKERDKSRK
jgi:tetratricopeptide (TPR) repeat protein